MQLLRKTVIRYLRSSICLPKKVEIEEQMMYNTFNMGLGMVLAIDPAEEEKALEIIERSRRVCICRWKDRSRRKGSDLMLRVLVCVSGGGTNLQAIIDACGKRNHHQYRSWLVVLSNQPKAYALERAKTHGIPGACVSRKDFGIERGISEETS